MNRKSLLLSSLIASVVLLGGGPSADASMRSWNAQCLSAAEAEISRLPVDRNDIDKINIVQQKSARGDHDIVQGYNVWVSLNSCQGSLVVALTPHCTVRESYTRGQCHIDGISGY
jgi:hypothetical protein